MTMPKQYIGDHNWKEKLIDRDLGYSTFRCDKCGLEADVRMDYILGFWLDGATGQECIDAEWKTCSEIIMMDALE